MSDSPSASQRPNVLHLPPEITDYTLGDIAVDYAAENGLRLYEWQAWCLRHILARREDGNWAARDSCLEVPRQNGKNAVIEALELFLVFIGGARLVVHSAHEQTTAAMHFKRMKELITNSDELMAEMPRTANQGFHTANGKERIELADGREISFKTRTGRTGRGPSPDAIVLDEAMILDDAALGAMTPSMSARRKSLLVFASSSPNAKSQTMWRLRRRALAGDGGRLFYAGWNSDPDVAPDDEANWFRCNPSLELGDEERPGKVLDNIRADMDTMSPEMFAVEHLGIPEEPPDTQGGEISAEGWELLTDATSKTDGSVRLAFDMTPDRQWCSFGVAGKRSDGLHHVEVRDRRPGDGWVVARAKELSTGHDTPVIVMSGSPGASFVPEFAAAGIPVDVMSPADAAAACGRFIDACAGLSPSIRHLGQPTLRVSISAARTKDAGDGMKVWSRKSTSTDIAPLTTVTAAFGRLAVAGPKKIEAMFAVT